MTVWPMETVYAVGRLSVTGYESDPRDTVMARHAERIKSLDIKNLDVLDSSVRWS